MEVIVQDANNIVIEVDQGRQGRGVEDVSLITVGADYYLLFTFTDGTTDQVGPIATTVTEVISAEVRNAEAVTILKGQPVYLFQAQGNLATVKLAYNTSDATSAKTLGLAAENIAPGAQGLITCQGTLGGLNTSAYNEGDTLYLGPTAGTLTNVKPQAPNHLVYIGVVERANAGAGQIYVRVQNGFELDEIHDVRIISPVNGNTLIYDASTSLWKNAGITAGTGVSVTNGPASITVGNTGVLSFSGGTTGLTPATATTGAVTLAGTLAIANGGTGQTTANAALNALLPSQVTQSGKYLKTDGTNASWDQLDISTADITGVLPTANGGTGLSSFTANGVVYASSASALTTGSGFTFANERLRVDRTSSGDVLYGTAFNANVGIFLERTGASPGSFRIIQTDAQESYFDASSASHKVIWRFNSVEQMRLTSTGLGIGTSSPQQRLHVANIPAGGGIRLSGPTTDNNWGGGIELYSDNASTIVSSIRASSGGILFSYGGSERMRLDSSGNLGIGTNSPSFRLHTNSTNQVVGLFQSNQTAASIAFQGTGSASNFAVRIGTEGTGLVAYTADTERARIDSTGNLLVGTTTNTNSSRLTVNGTISETVSGVQYLVASQFDVGTAPNKIPLNQYLGNLAYQNASAIAGQVGVTAGTAALPSIVSATDTATGQWFPATSVMAWSTAGSERMRLDASGNLALGTTSAGGARLRIVGASGGASVIVSASNATSQPSFGIQAGSPGFFDNSGLITYNGNAKAAFEASLTSFLDNNVRVKRYLEGYDATANNIDFGTSSTQDFVFNTSGARILHQTSQNNSIVSRTNSTQRLEITGGGNIVIGTAAIATTATDGFLYIPTCAGAPTGTPTAQTGRAPLVVDSTNNRFYVYVGGTWKYAALV